MSLGAGMCWIQIVIEIVVYDKMKEMTNWEKKKTSQRMDLSSFHLSVIWICKLQFYLK